MKRFMKLLPVLPLLLVGILSLGGALISSQVVSADAVDVVRQSCDQASGYTSALCDDTDKELLGENSIFGTITNIFLFVVAAISVIMIVVGGLRYVISNGDQTAVTGAKNTIFYSVIGLVVALMAYAIVNFVLTNI